MMTESVCLGRLRYFLRLLLVVYIMGMADTARSTEHTLTTSDADTSEKITASDLQQRQRLLHSFQVTAFHQFTHWRTGILYNVTSFPGTLVQAIRLRHGRFHKYGVNISEFRVPYGCIVEPAPQRILLVYARFASNSSFLFGGLPGHMNVVLPVVSLFGYDASYLNSTEALSPLSVSTSSEAISVQFQPYVANASCIYFSDNSTAVVYSDMVEGGCVTHQLGVFSRASMTSTPSSSSVSPSPSNRKLAWKIATGVTIAGVIILALLGVLAIGISQCRKSAKFAKMEYDADQGETLENTLVHNSRVPAAGGTRTQPGLEEDYAHLM